MEYPTPLSKPTTMAEYCSISAQRGGVWRTWLLFRAARQQCAITDNAKLTLPQCTWPAVECQTLRQGAIDEWLIMLRMAALLWSFVKAFNCLSSCSFVGWQWLPAAFQVAIFPIHSSMFRGHFCCVGCQEQHVDDKLGLRAEWGLSKRRCIRSDEKRQMLAEEMKKKKNSCCTEQAAITVFGACTLFELRNGLVTKSTCNSALPL